MAHTALPAPRLTNFRAFDTTDVHLAHAELTKVFCDHELVSTDADGAFSGLLNVVRIRSVTATCIRFRRDTRAATDATGFFGVQIP